MYWSGTVKNLPEPHIDTIRRIRVGIDAADHPFSPTRDSSDHLLNGLEPPLLSRVDPS